MPVIFKSLKQAISGVDRARQKGVKRALNKAAKRSKTYIRKSLKKEIGVEQTYIDRRMLLNKTANGIKNKYSFKAGNSVSFARNLPLRLFKPKEKVVRIKIQPRVGKAFKSRRMGVTVKEGMNKRILVPGGFLMKVKSGAEIVAQRKTLKRTPTREVYSIMLQKILKQNEKQYDKQMNDVFESIVDDEIEYVFSKAFNAVISDE